MTDDKRKPRIRARRLLGALSGGLAGFAALAVAELVSPAVRPQAGPVVAVGGAAMVRSPPPRKAGAHRQFRHPHKNGQQARFITGL
ncbi:hypothetical protein ACFW15_35890, partial [Streptomyces sp. NPDC058953]